MPELSATLQTFCGQAELLRLAFLDREGFPRVVPVWFVRLDGAYYIGIGTPSAKWKAMQRDARVGWVIDGGTRGHYQGVSSRAEKRRQGFLTNAGHTHARRALVEGARAYASPPPPGNTTQNPPGPQFGRLKRDGANATDA